MELLAPRDVAEVVEDVYASLGVRRVINATCHWTRFGGTIMPPQVLAAMHAAANAYVDVGALLDAASERISRHTHADATYVVSGCAAALMVGAAAVMVGEDARKAAMLPEIAGPRRWIARRFDRRAVPGTAELPTAYTHFGYAQAVRGAGGTFVEVGTEDAVLIEEIDAAIDDETAGMYWLAGDPPGAPSPEALIALARDRAVPILIDASNVLPPPESLHRYIDAGADLVAFSGGKGLHGPQGSGFLTGRADLVRAARALGSPNQGIGRVCKVSKEEMVGLVTALDLWVDRDHRAERRRAERRTLWLYDQLGGLTDAEPEYVAVDHLGRPFPTVHLRLDSGAGMTERTLRQRLLDGSPSIAIMPGFDPWTARIDVRELDEEDIQKVADAILAILMPASIGR
ncbi:MAG: aminotransferase class V-fold PLP-dependent enzyme [Chloroflexi bacterium]|nr:aminotransferase class V-fold PLP-dependent enzyme [Chloroflexota bacterium]